MKSFKLLQQCISSLNLPSNSVKLTVLCIVFMFTPTSSITLFVSTMWFLKYDIEIMKFLEITAVFKVMSSWKEFFEINHKITTTKMLHSWFVLPPSPRTTLCKLLPFLLSSIYIRRKHWIRENFRLPVFDGLTCFEMSWTRLDHF